MPSKSGEKIRSDNLSFQNVPEIHPLVSLPLIPVKEIINIHITFAFLIPL